MPEFITQGTGFFGLGPYLNILPLVTIGLFIWQQKMFMPPPADEQAALQQKMMQYMMIFMGVLVLQSCQRLVRVLHRVEHLGHRRTQAAAQGETARPRHRRRDVIRCHRHQRQRRRCQQRSGSGAGGKSETRLALIPVLARHVPTPPREHAIVPRHQACEISMWYTDDTIAAIASAPGGAARASCALSGPRCRVDRGRLLSARTTTAISTALKRPTARGGHVRARCSAMRIETAGRLAVVARRPQLHAAAAGRNPYDGLAAAGGRACFRRCARPAARLAEPGEFTLRAFLAGRIDLTQAEAVLGVIDARGPDELGTGTGAIGRRIGRTAAPPARVAARTAGPLRSRAGFCRGGHRVRPSPMRSASN